MKILKFSMKHEMGFSFKDVVGDVGDVFLFVCFGELRMCQVGH